MKVIVAVVAVLAGLLGVGWLLTGNELAMQQVFAPKFEQTRRETFEQSKAFRDGVIQELRSMQFDYIKADPTHQAGLASVIRHKATQLPREDLPADLLQFIDSLPQ